MTELGKKIAWKATKTSDTHVSSSEAINPFDYFLGLCAKKLPHKKLYSACKVFEEQKNGLKAEQQKFIEVISKEPFLACFLIWIKEIGPSRPNILEDAKALLEHGLIGVSDNAGNLWTIGNARDFDHRIILDTIRCHEEFPLEVREKLVQTYIAFIFWLCGETYGYIQRLEDPDVLKSKGRALAYPFFIAFLQALSSDKARLVAKLLYFGGSRTLEEVLQLSIENVNFEKKFIHFGTQLPAYPAHVFNDIKALTSSRTKGKVFFGRQQASLNPATIFRNFKEAALKVGLGQSFTPANLTMNA